MIGSQTEKRSRRRGNGWFWFAVFILALGTAYAGGWYYLADRLVSRARTELAALQAAGTDARCEELRADGFPFRMTIGCDNARFAGNGTEAQTPGLQASYRLWKPLTLEASLQSPLQVEPSGTTQPLRLDFTNLLAQVQLTVAMEQSLHLSGSNVVLRDSSGEAGRVNSLQLQGKPEGNDLSGTAQFAGFSIAPALLDGRSVPPLDGAADVTLRDGMRFVQDGARSWRGASGNITNLQLGSGTAGVTIAGPLGVGTDGVVEADLTVTIRQPRGVADIVAAVFPDNANQIRAGFTGLAALGDNPTLPLKIRKGQAALGFIPLGSIPPLP